MTKPSTRGKREQVSNACTSCRLSKLKCNGRHPACFRCLSKDLECVYDVSEGMTKRQHLNHELIEQKLELERAVTVLRVLQYGTDQEATASLARLRLGGSVEQEYCHLQPHVAQPANLMNQGMSQPQLPTPANEYPESLAPWSCPAGGYVEWNALGARPMEWANPISPVSQPASSTGRSTAESPFLDGTAAAPGGNDAGDRKLSYIGG